MRKIFAIALLLFFQMTSTSAQADIADARTYSQGLGLTITGIVTSGDEFGDIRYIQDETAGIPVYDPDFSAQMQIGDEVTITGEMGMFMGLIQVTDFVSFNKNSSGNPLPDAQLVTPNQLNADIEAELVTIENVTFNDGESGAQFTGNTSFAFVSNGEASVVYVRSGSPLVGTTIPETPVSITGIVSQFNGSYQLLIRQETDIDGDFVDDISQTNITTSSFDISWTSNFEGSSNLRYGTSADNLDQEITNSNSAMDHNISITGLDAASIYYLQVFTENVSQSAQSAIRVFATESNSTGEMRIFFNHAVDNSVSTGVDAVYISGAAVEDQIIDYIDNAQNTIDMSIYNINRIPIVQALNNAKDRGVIVRYIANTGTLNSALDDGEASFPLIKVNGTALMHNKFMIVDRESVDESWVMSGSTNLTSQNLGNDFNNILFIQDQTLAKAYTLEFNEMWGTDGPEPAIFGIRVGDAKKDNTPHHFIIGGDLVESYFSPSDNTTNKITNALRTANIDLDFATLTFTMNDMRDALFFADQNGVAVRGLIENTNDLGSDFDALVSGGLNVKDHPASGSIHHKYAIVDHSDPSSDPLVITGSHNWSASAENNNDENTLIIHSAIVANVYFQEFEARWNGILESIKGVKSIPGFEVNILPNPVQNQAKILMDIQNTNDIVVSLWTMNGQQLQSNILRKVNGKDLLEMNVSSYPSGNYLVSFQIGNQIMAKQLVIQR